MQADLLKLIHSSHLGMEKCKRRAKDAVFWPGMNKQIEDTVSQCPTCCAHQKNNPKEPLLSHDVPKRPWEKVGADLFEIHSKHYPALVDYYSGFIEVENVHEATSNKIINICKSQFARHGIPAP